MSDERRVRNNLCVTVEATGNRTCDAPTMDAERTLTAFWDLRRKYLSSSMRCEIMRGQRRQMDSDLREIRTTNNTCNGCRSETTGTCTAVGGYNKTTEKQSVRDSIQQQAHAPNHWAMVHDSH